MTEFLNYNFEDNETFINTFDEAPLWSASFGLFLLKHLDIKPNQTVIDIGSGAGFPLMELAGRMGSSSKLYGIDTWGNANKRAKQKIKNYGYSNVEIIETSAEKIPFEDNSIDKIVSNLGINNFEKPDIVFKECCRALKQRGKLSITTNLMGHWSEFYQVFYSTLNQISKENLIPLLKNEEEHRASLQSIGKLFTENGFTVTKQFEECYEMKFVDGSAFLNHHFVKVGWLTTWLKLFPKEELIDIFSALEQNLNEYSTLNGGLILTVPMLFIEGEKI